MDLHFYVWLRDQKPGHFGRIASGSMRDKMESTLFFLRVSFISCFIGGHHFVILHNFSGKMEPPIDQFPLDPFFPTGRIAGDHTGNLLLQFGSLNMTDVEETQISCLFSILFLHFWFLEGNFPGAPQSAREKEKGLTSQLIRKESLLSFEWCCIIYILFVIHGECFTMFYINIYSESCWAKSDFLPTDIPPIQLLFMW